MHDLKRVQLLVIKLGEVHHKVLSRHARLYSS